MWKRGPSPKKVIFSHPYSQLMGLCHQTSPNPSPARTYVTSYEKHTCHQLQPHQLYGAEGMGPAAPCMPLSAVLGAHTPSLPSEECQECQVVLLGGEEGELAIPQGHREFHPWARLRSPGIKKVQPETGNPAPSHIRLGMFCMSSGEEPESAAVLGISIVF